MKTLVKLAALAAVLAPGAALAVPLAPGDVVATSGTTFDPSNSGLVINDNLLSFRMDPTPGTPLTDVGGAVQNRVLRNAFDNMVFMPRIRDTFNIDGGTFGFTGFRLEGYGNYDVDVDFRTDGLGDKGPSTVSRSVDGDIMTFRYDDPIFVDAIAPGFQQTSYFPSLVTNAKAYEETGTMTVFGQLFALDFGAPPRAIGDLVSVEIQGIAVPTAVPIPAPLMMLGTVIAGMIGLRRRKA